MRRSLLLLLILVVACARDARTSAPLAERSSVSIDARALLRHMSALSSDAFEGRAPGTPGEDRTVDYITSQLKLTRLPPGNPDGSYVQTVPMVAVTSRPSLAIESLPKSTSWKNGEDYTLWSYSAGDVKIARSELVFVGYGVVAPELGWDDFKDVDVKGKTLVFLIGDPPIPDPSDASRLDPRMFRGDAMTYYGRWTYKYEIAAQKGAAAALIIHETKPAGYGWGVVAAGADRERFEITEARGRGHAGAEGWLHLDRAKEILPDFDQLKAAALDKGFRPVPLKTTASLDVTSTARQVTSRNVVARVTGSDPKLKDEHVIYSAHWDHLGHEKERIFHGALDNASGVAWLLETARAFTMLDRPPRRSILFLAVTAEEYGLLGSRYYAEHPLYPLERTIANINMDIMNPWGRTRSIVSIGNGQTTMDDVLASFAAKQRRRVVSDPEPEKGYYYRSDHFELAKKGVPALGFLFPGADYIDRPASFGADKRQEYVAHAYHTPNDVVKADWDLAGAVEDTELLLRVGIHIAEADGWPEWKPGTEFKARRDAMLRR